MTFGTLRQRVERAEVLVEGRAQETRLHWRQLRTTWRAGWSPVRIVLVGFGLGLVTGRNEPQAALGSIAGKLGGIPKILQMISTISALLTAHRAQEASEQAERAADNAEEVAADPPVTVVQVPVDRAA
ncbi:hypothetical protein LL965_14775 [Xanthomonas cassavae CFBP 4642]|uniref:Protein sip-5 n=1 Tax=Xanthomonas cassavae CFBP 4642 TaxID=1219375 RepID=A0ABS8HGI1_9XANT|nr:hypothetical protein [Xanthomonas cassavae]MCC4621288.1 hypothetical protein [Xanthomonas cassavae CFBP 4642]